ncbi:MAG: hypothetical protein KF780_05860 [Sphingomonas sp.]|nr:hypothetical protein [Sphingomonas sp.]
MKKQLLMSGFALATMFGAVGAQAAEISITPRFGLYFDNTEQRQSGFGGIETTADTDLADLDELIRILDPTAPGFTLTPGEGAGASTQVLFPLFGASVTIGGERTQVTFTGLYGKATGTIRTITTQTLTLEAFGFEATDQLVTATTGNSRYKRLDLELTAQHRLNETFALIGGVRYERVTGRGTFTGTTTSSSNISNLISLAAGDGDIDIGIGSQAQTFINTSESETYSIRAGAAAFVPVSRSVLTYVNGLVHLSHSPASGGTTILTTPDGQVSTAESRIGGETAFGPDISVGMLLRMSDNVALDLRYRGIFYFPISGPRSLDDPRVNHGLNIGLTFSL